MVTKKYKTLHPYGDGLLSFQPQLLDLAVWLLDYGEGGAADGGGFGGAGGCL